MVIGDGLIIVGVPLWQSIVGSAYLKKPVHFKIKFALSCVEFFMKKGRESLPALVSSKPPISSGDMLLIVIR